MKLHLYSWWENGLERKYTKFFVYCWHSNKVFSKTYLLTSSNIGENFIAIELYRCGLWKTISKHPKVRPSANLLMWKLCFILMQLNSFPQERRMPLASFWKWEFWTRKWPITVCLIFLLLVPLVANKWIFLYSSKKSPGKQPNSCSVFASIILFGFVFQ